VNRASFFGRRHRQAQSALWRTGARDGARESLKNKQEVSMLDAGTINRLRLEQSKAPISRIGQ
jgi:hypothetical protein